MGCEVQTVRMWRCQYRDRVRWAKLHRRCVKSSCDAARYGV